MPSAIEYSHGTAQPFHRRQSVPTHGVRLVNETKHLLRLVIPGVLFSVEATLLAWIMAPKVFESLPEGLLDQQSLGTIAVALAASGVLGYFLATLHHFVHWTWFDGSVVSHVAAVTRWRAEGLVSRPADETSLNRRSALLVLTTEWFSRMGTNRNLADAYARTQSLGDAAHAAGTARMAAALALLVAFGARVWSYGLSCEDCHRVVLGATLGMLVLLLFDDNYRRMGRLHARFTEELLERVLRAERPSCLQPVEDSVTSLTTASVS